MSFRYNSEDSDPYRIIVKSLAEFCVWLEYMKNHQDASIRPNGMNGVIVVTKKRYIVADAF